VRCAVLTVSDTRSLENDPGGSLLAGLLEEAGHEVVSRSLVRDELELLREQVRKLLTEPRVQVVLLTGGTGLAPRDVTPEAVAPLLERSLPGFGELFRWLSYQEIGSAALLSRAFAGSRGDKLLFALPGSPAAIRTALEKLVLPELGHLVGEAGKGSPHRQGGPQERR